MASEWHKKLWGAEEWLVNNDAYCGKFLYLEPGFRSSLHYHRKKKETFIALEGLTVLEVYGDYVKYYKLLRGSQRDSFTLEPGTPHRFWTTSSRGAVVLEVSTPHDEADVVRLVESARVG